MLISNGLPQPIRAQSYLEDEYPVQQCSKHQPQILLAYTQSKKPVCIFSHCNTHMYTVSMQSKLQAQSEMLFLQQQCRCISQLFALCTHVEQPSLRLCIHSVQYFTVLGLRANYSPECWKCLCKLVCVYTSHDILFQVHVACLHNTFRFTLHYIGQMRS